ncbi:AciT family ciprofloxacin tolerance protein [Psychrobacter glacincola]|uniref:AciT family ciprofloxacin tolerance protein n=1 Tax=Psychrobacter glacincola TaxID=56810 RepID=A0ABW1W6S9_9GAMM|nr:AciT family ciprofloxacin tolerance protein [Psychrobacter glacincola]
MLLTLFSTFASEALSTSAIVSYGLFLIAVVAIAVSSQRWLLWYLFGGMGYWLAVEMIHSLLTHWFVWSEWHNYVIAMGISWLPLGAWVLYRALRYEDVSQAVQQQRELEAARYIEHSPVYDDDYQPRFY